MSKWFAYYGDFKRIAGRVVYEDKFQAIMDIWNDTALFGLHPSDEETRISRIFKVRSSNPGWCFQCAGWRKAGRSKDRGLVLLVKELPLLAMGAV